MKEEFEVEYPLAEATAAVGFFFVLMLEQLVTSYCIGKKKQNKDGRTSASKATEAVAAANEPGAEAKHVQVDILSNSNVIQSPQTQPIDPSFQIVQKEEHDDHAHFDMASQSKMRTLILVGALSLHAIFEGLVFGLSSGEVGDILGTMSAVLIHKSIIAFSTGMQLVSSEIEHVYLSSAICIFSMMAPLGVGIGILITVLGGETIGALIAVLESFAAGTFFYVTFLELVPHEFVGKHVKHGPLKCAIMFSGFMFMAIFQYLNPEEEE